MFKSTFVRSDFSSHNAARTLYLTAVALYVYAVTMHVT